MAAVGLALLSALLFGGMSVGLRLGLARYPDAELATLATVGGALVVALVAAAAEAPSRGVHAGAAWPFALAGMLQPGIGQLLVTLAIKEAGASRASVVFGSAPLISVAIALTFLHEPVSVPLLAGAVLVVAGGVELARERDRPEHLRRLGLALALGATALFAIRDNVLRWLAGSTTVPPAVAAAAALAGGGLVTAAIFAPRIRSAVRLRAVAPFLGVGVLFGLSYVCLFEAYYRGRVTVVSPLVATESLVGVGLSLLLIRQSEQIGRRLAVGAGLIVAGGVLIGAFR
ncbi:MAG: EamA family transporter [Gaiellaceae bacterium]